MSAWLLLIVSTVYACMHHCSFTSMSGINVLFPVGAISYQLQGGVTYATARHGGQTRQLQVLYMHDRLLHSPLVREQSAEHICNSLLLLPPCASLRGVPDVFPLPTSSETPNVAETPVGQRTSKEAAACR